MYFILFCREVNEMEGSYETQAVQAENNVEMVQEEAIEELEMERSTCLIQKIAEPMAIAPSPQGTLVEKTADDAPTPCASSTSQSTEQPLPLPVYLLRKYYNFRLLRKSEYI